MNSSSEKLFKVYFQDENMKVDWQEFYHPTSEDGRIVLKYNVEKPNQL